MIQLEDMRRPVAKELARFKEYYRDALDVPTPSLRLILWYVLRRPGKQIRPLLVYLSAAACGEITEMTTTAAAMVEMVHNASLLHDDVVDEGELRRGVPTVYKIWKAKGAVLAGDFMLAQGLQLAVRTHAYQLLELMNDAVQRMSRGELQQLRRARKKDSSIEGYFEVIEGKTAALLAACTAAGACSVQAPKERVDTMYRFGQKLGMAFQIRDDILDFSTEKKTGKTIGNDLQEGKLTLPILYALEGLTGAERTAMWGLLKMARKDKNARAEAVELIMKSQAIPKATETLKSFIQEAKDELEVIPPSQARQSLLDFADYLVIRTR